MSVSLIIASYANALAEGEIPDSIMFIPEGEHTIHASVNGKPRKFDAKMPSSKGQEIAARFNKQLETLKAQNVRPYFDFLHEGGKAAALPQRFSYEEGRGLMVDVEWTGAGRTAIEAKDFSYFSPTVLMAENGEPFALPERGALGGLVNEPAFRNIERIAAAHAIIPDEPQPKTTDMSATLLIKAGILTESEGAAENAVVMASEKVTGLKAAANELVAVKAQNVELTNKVEKLEAVEVARNEKDAEDAVLAAVSAGKIEAKDEATQSFWKDAIKANPEGGKAALLNLKAQHAELKEDIVGKGSQGGAAKVSKLEARATQIQKEDGKLTIEAARAQAASESSELYEEYRDSLGK